MDRSSSSVLALLAAASQRSLLAKTPESCGQQTTQPPQSTVKVQLGQDQGNKQCLKGQTASKESTPQPPRQQGMRFIGVTVDVLHKLQQLGEAKKLSSNTQIVNYLLQFYEDATSGKPQCLKCHAILNVEIYCSDCNPSAEDCSAPSPTITPRLEELRTFCTAESSTLAPLDHTTARLEELSAFLTAKLSTSSDGTSDDVDNFAVENVSSLPGSKNLCQTVGASQISKNMTAERSCSSLPADLSQTVLSLQSSVNPSVQMVSVGPSPKDYSQTVSNPMSSDKYSVQLMSCPLFFREPSQPVSNEVSAENLLMLTVPRLPSLTKDLPQTVSDSESTENLSVEMDSSPLSSNSLVQTVPNPVLFENPTPQTVSLDTVCGEGFTDDSGFPSFEEPAETVSDLQLSANSVLQTASSLLPSREPCQSVSNRQSSESHSVQSVCSFMSSRNHPHTVSSSAPSDHEYSVQSVLAVPSSADRTLEPASSLLSSLIRSFQAHKSSSMDCTRTLPIPQPVSLSTHVSEGQNGAVLTENFSKAITDEQDDDGQRAANSVENRGAVKDMDRNMSSELSAVVAACTDIDLSRPTEPSTQSVVALFGAKGMYSVSSAVHHGTELVSSTADGSVSCRAILTGIARQVTPLSAESSSHAEDILQADSRIDKYCIRDRTKNSNSIQVEENKNCNSSCVNSACPTPSSTQSHINPLSPIPPSTQLSGGQNGAQRVNGTLNGLEMNPGENFAVDTDTVRNTRKDFLDSGVTANTRGQDGTVSERPKACKKYARPRYLETRGNPYHCIDCNESFPFVKNFEEHLYERSDSRYGYKCRHCGVSLLNYKDAKAHCRTHLRDKPFKCPYKDCSASFATRPAMLEHHKNLHCGKQRLCNTCGKFVSSYNFTRHMQRHTGDRPCKCRFCDRTFIHGTARREHERIHNGSKPYKCHTCSAAFSQSSHLKSHLRTHTGQRPYTCVYCSLTFITSSVMQRHVRRRHEPFHN